MAISIHNYTILDHLADYLLRIREAVQGDGSYQYVCVMERRCFNLVARFSPELLDRVVTSNGLLCMGKEIARYYEENYDFPRMLVCDDIVIHGRNLARFFYTLEEEVVGILEAEGFTFTFEQRQGLHRRLIDAVDIYAYVRSKHPLLLEYGYIQKIEYDHACSDMEIHDISLQITDFLNRSGATSTSFVISFPKTVLTRQVETDVGDWKRGERNLYGCVNENESAPNRRMISYIRTVCEGRPQSWISTVRYYPGEEKNQWITSAPIFEDCSLERLQSICRQIDSHLEEEQARGKQYQKLRSILREEKTDAYLKWTNRKQLVSFFASVADFFDFYEAYEGQPIQDEAAQKELVDGSNWRKISANFRGIEERGRNDQRTDEELYRFCCDRVLQRAVQGILNVEMKPFVLQPVGHILDGPKHFIDAAASQVASEEGMRQEADAYALEERPYSFQPERHNGGIISFSSFFKKMSGLVEASISVVEGTTTILKLMDDGIVGLRLHQDSETKELQTVLKVGELATFYWPMQLSVYVPALALVERSCWRQNMEQKEAVLRFLKEQAFEPGDRLPKHLREFEVADVQRCLLAWTEKLYHAGQSYRGWDFDNLEQRREQEVQEEGIRATMLNRAKEFLYLQ